jgi:hypothetical protein
MTAAIDMMPINGVIRASKFSPEHIEILEKRGIPIDLAEAAGLESISSILVPKLLGSDKSCAYGGLAIPYAGTCPPYWRIRMDRGDVRYLCPKGRPVPIYRPPPYEAACPDDLADALVIVEAPLKALALAAVGLSAVGLGGVATTLDKDGSLNASWHVLAVRGRDVRVLFDAGRAMNDKVRAAEDRLVAALERAGANVRVCSLPPTDVGEDQGPDDYLAQHGAEALYEVVRSATKTKPDPSTPASVFAQWRVEGPLVHEPTGFEALDKLTGGGPVYGCRVYTPGAPDAGKTGIAVHIGDTWARRGIAIGFHAIDEEAGDVQTRIAQRAGFTRKQCEERDPRVLDDMEADLGDLPILYFGPEHTIERAAEELDSYATARGITRKALFVDTIQLASCEATRRRDDMSPREIVTANVNALRAVATRYRLIAWGISEMNRGAYRSIESAENTNDMASGAESRAIEFSARVMLTLRSVKDHGDLVDVKVVKNKLGPSGDSFFLRIDREHMRFVTSGAPEIDPAQLQREEDQERAKSRQAVERDADKLADVVRRNPGLGEVALRGALRAAGFPWGVERYGAAKAILEAGHKGQRLRDRNEGKKGCKYHLEPISKGGQS